MKAVTGILKRPGAGGAVEVAVPKRESSVGVEEPDRGVVALDRVVGRAVEEGAREQAARVALVVGRETERGEKALRRWQESVLKVVCDVASKDLEEAVTKSIRHLMTSMQGDIEQMLEDSLRSNLEQQLSTSAAKIAGMKIEQSRKNKILKNAVEAVLSSSALNAAFGQVFVDTLLQPIQTATQGVLQRVTADTAATMGNQLSVAVTASEKAIAQSTDRILENMNASESLLNDGACGEGSFQSAGERVTVETLVADGLWLEATEKAAKEGSKMKYLVKAVLSAEIESESFLGDLSTEAVLSFTQELSSDLAYQTEARLLWIDEAVEALCSESSESHLREREISVLEFVLNALKAGPGGDSHRNRRTMRLVNSELILLRRGNSLLDFS